MKRSPSPFLRRQSSQQKNLSFEMCSGGVRLTDRYPGYETAEINHWTIIWEVEPLLGSFFFGN